MPDATIQTVGKVLRQLNPILYRVELKNGKRVMAHLSKLLTAQAAEFSVGALLLLELTAYDFDQARILKAAD
jgi:translation initiation factor IF-1